MVFMGMRQKNRFDVICVFSDEFRVRANEIDAGRRMITKRDPNVDQYPFSGMGRTIPVSVEIHSDFAAAAKR